jgi:hypothetical protein
VTVPQVGVILRTTGDVKWREGRWSGRWPGKCARRTLGQHGAAAVAAGRSGCLGSGRGGKVEAPKTVPSRGLLACSLAPCNPCTLTCTEQRAVGVFTGAVQPVHSDQPASQTDRQTDSYGEARCVHVPTNGAAPPDGGTHTCSPAGWRGSAAQLPRCGAARMCSIQRTRHKQHAALVTRAPERAGACSATGLASSWRCAALGRRGQPVHRCLAHSRSSCVWMLRLCGLTASSSGVLLQ